LQHLKKSIKIGKSIMQRFKVFLALLTVLALFAACRDLTAPTTLDSGIEGQVYDISHPGPIPIGWVAPAMENTVTIIVFDSDKNELMEVQTNADGSFFVALAPGTYFLGVKESPVPTESGPFSLLPHQHLQVKAYYDNGMR
jgi:hypothetical protein